LFQRWARRRLAGLIMAETRNLLELLDEGRSDARQ